MLQIGICKNVLAINWESTYSQTNKLFGKSHNIVKEMKIMNTNIRGVSEVT